MFNMGVHMKFNLLQKRSAGWLFGALLVLTFVLVNFNTALADYDRPGVPRLSLTGNDQWDDTWYPDGRIWLPPAANGPREFLMPVFVDNRWATYEETKDIYRPNPIKSFRFTVLYNMTAVRPVSVEMSWPMKDERLGYLPLANKFNISWNDQKDWSYGSYFEAEPAFDMYSKGRAITISATSTEALPNTDLYGDEFKVLLYIRFRVIPEVGSTMGNAQFTPIYIKNDTIMWNDLNVRKDPPFVHLRPEYMGRDVSTDYPNPQEFTGLAGVNNRPYPLRWDAGWRCLPGAIYLRYSDNVPEFGWKMQRGIGTIPPIYEFEPAMWDLRDPITVDSGSTNPSFGKRIVQIENKITSSRLLDVYIESDQPWLLFRTVPGPANKNPIPAPTRYGYINWMDNGILGESAVGTPIPTINSAVDGQVHLELRCDPSRLTEAPNSPTPEMTGIYVGYVTFKSATAGVNPIKLRVTFIYFRPPIEFNTTVNKAPGIHMDIYNSAATTDSVKLIFGTGHRATNGVDTLFGEYAYDFDMSPFEARWFPPPTASDELKATVPFGFGDFAPDDDPGDGSPKRSNSRDIRDIRDTNQSIIYYCKISEDNANHYPLVLEWDVADFPDGSQLFLKDNVNGFYFPDVDMRRATGLGPTRRSFTIQDARVKEFIIEYTLPRVIDYVDEYGQPIIKKGWNLLSLPVRPVNRHYKVVYPNGINIPYFFSQNQYQAAESGMLNVGVGYYIKYGQTVDTKFAGTYISTIKKDGTPTDVVRVYPGWNTIGNVSRVLNTSKINFAPFVLELPSSSYTKAAGVWGYVTSRGYVEVSEMRPGLGYWIKCDANGYLALDASLGKVSLAATENPRELAYNSSSKLSILDNAQNNSELFFGRNASESMFELPPAPPTEVFDVRFNQNTKLTVNDEAVIKLQGVSYPVALTMNNADATYNFYEAATGNFIGQISKGTNGSVEVTRAAAVKVVKADNEFFVSNYPNPVVGLTQVNFAIPSDENVVVKIYNTLGVEVGTIAEGFRKAGSYTESFNAEGLVSGSYIIKITAGSNTAIQNMTVVR
jgi:hypothetical protein